ncbi:hypothetical protein [Streptomyces sp. 900105755]
MTSSALLNTLLAARRGQAGATYLVAASERQQRYWMEVFTELRRS